MASDLLEWHHEVAPAAWQPGGLDDTYRGGVAVAKRTPLIIPCAHCGQRFDAHAKRGRPRIYCSMGCNTAAYRARVKAEQHTYGICEEDGCEKFRRHPGSRFCGTHHTYWSRKHPGEGLQGGTCRHCGKPTDSRRLFYCSQLCRTRTRVGVPYQPNRPCVICGMPIPHEATYNRAGCCSPACTDMARTITSYGITVEQYRAMRSAQEGRCAICRKVAKLRIDHHHSEGVVRGLLCNECNLGLGLFGDDPAVLRSAAAYLDRLRAMTKQGG